MDECATNNGRCAIDIATCTNRLGDDPICACKTGYSGDGFTCDRTSEQPVFEYRAPKDQFKNHDSSAIEIVTQGSNIVLIIEGVTHLRPYAKGTSCILLFPKTTKEISQSRHERCRHRLGMGEGHVPPGISLYFSDFFLQAI